MGRRGGGGGSAGGGRSVQEEPVDPMQAKRESATHHLGKDVEDKRQMRKEPRVEPAEEIDALEKQGFSVICAEKGPDTKSSAPRTSEDKTPYKLGSRGIEKAKKSRKKRSAKQLSFDVEGDSENEDEL
ncbi:hypothetical protein FGB62_68g138 [Gracilaria domingensis]|nr:hypothetical protein FGB62_68g138 [Gracilaria domingensis]